MEEGRLEVTQLLAVVYAEGSQSTAHTLCTIQPGCAALSERMGIRRWKSGCMVQEHNE